MRVGLLVTDRPTTPSGTGRAAPHFWLSGAPADGGRTHLHVRSNSSQAGNPGAPETTEDQPLGGGPSWGSTTSLVFWGRSRSSFPSCPCRSCLRLTA